MIVLRYPKAGLTDPAVANYTSIPANGKKTVSFKPLFGLLNQPKYLPLQWGGLVLEF
jgi:hypothetical protein